MKYYFRIFSPIVSFLDFLSFILIFISIFFASFFLAGWVIADWVLLWPQLSKMSFLLPISKLFHFFQ